MQTFFCELWNSSSPEPLTFD